MAYNDIVYGPTTSGYAGYDPARQSAVQAANIAKWSFPTPTAQGFTDTRPDGSGNTFRVMSGGIGDSLNWVDKSGRFYRDVTADQFRQFFPGMTDLMSLYYPGAGGAAGGGTSATPTPQTPGTSTAQGFSGSQMPTPWGGQAPLTNAALQGLGFGLRPFDPSAYNSVADSITNRLTKNLNENVLPGIAQAGQAAGQYGGGSRRSLAQGKAISGMNQQAMDAIAPYYTQGYENWLNRGLQAGQMGMQGLLGLGQLDISRMNAQTGAAQAAAQAAGVPMYTSPWASALGGALGAAQLGQLFGLWGNTPVRP